jgi:glucosamine-6-phosphate deaminase
VERNREVRAVQRGVRHRNHATGTATTQRNPQKDRSMNKGNLEIHASRTACGKAAATYGAERIRAALRAHGAARIIVATGASQFEMLEALVAAPDIDWTRVTAFHLDEYVGIPITHPASFRQYLWKRFVSRLPLPLAAFHYLNGEGDADAECRRVGKALKAAPIDVAFVGIGENGHLAFNDPPADFATPKPYLVVELDTACRRQQLGEGWFKTLRQVPRQAISMSIRQIMAARAIVCTVPDARKAQAVKDCLAGEVTPLHPASILQNHADTRFFLDKPAASLLG